jgi:hypothetical protein
MTDDELMSRRFQALASASDRHFIELVSLRPRTRPELTRHFDYTAGQLYFVGKQLCALNFLTVAQGPERYDYDPQGLAAVLKWIMRIESIRSGTPQKNSS